MRTHCRLCGDEINLLCDRHFEISLNKYVCGVCVETTKTEELKKLLEKKLEEKNDAAAAAKRLGEAIKEYSVNVGERNAKD